jgi:flavin reductase (DIM6/NTAB) family NADH-FMN oxidoreductase RutF
VAVSTNAFKAAMRKWPSGVTVVTSHHDGEVHGMTVSAFTSLSVDPPRVLISIGTGSYAARLIAASGAFVVNVLASEQQELSRRFAGMTRHKNRFDGLSVSHSAAGCPILDDALVAFECSLLQAHEIGDHVLEIGDVQHLRVRDAAQPLIYLNGSYRSGAE